MGTLTTGPAVEVHVTHTAGAPTLFITTAMPKSGSNWLEAMLFSLPGVGGFGEREGSCGFLTLSALVRVPEALPFLERAGMSTGDALARLLEPSVCRGAAIEEALRPDAERVLAKVRLRVPPRTGLLGGAGSSVPPLRRMVDPLFAQREGRDAGSAFAAVGCPSKHEPPAQLATRLPGWKIVQIVRDPRDVLVSRFYHDLAHMDPVMAGMFVKGTGTGARMRADWMEAYFGKRRDEMLAYYEGFEEHLPGGSKRLVVRYEDLLADTARELRRAAEFIGIGGVREPELRKVCERFAFDRVAGEEQAQLDSKRQERRNSFLRKGKAGDWRGYFDRRLTSVLGERFNDLLTRLEYEPDSRWIQSVPTSGEFAWDFARLRVRAALARSFRAIWDADPSLQARFADPADVRLQGGSFVDALMASGNPAVNSHRATLEAMARMWKADVQETVQF